MTVIFQAPGVPGWYTTDPEVVPGSRQLHEGDYVRLPNGMIFFMQQDSPPILTKVVSQDVPIEVTVLNAQVYKW